MPFAVESAGAFDVAALDDAMRDAANAAGLLAAADLPAALSVVLPLSGTAWRRERRRGRSAHARGDRRPPEALALLRFAVSDEYDELARALEA